MTVHVENCAVRRIRGSFHHSVRIWSFSAVQLGRGRDREIPGWESWLEHVLGPRFYNRGYELGVAAIVRSRNERGGQDTC
jgi:hypothetical protein